MTKVYPILLSGGAGSRLWPISVNNNPKQFTNLVDDEYLFENTLKRCNHKIFENHPIVVCANHHLDLVQLGLKNQNVKKSSIILEPCARNTAPAVVVSTLYAYQQDKEAIVMAMASDHFIKNESAFIQAVETAVNASQKGYLTTFGIKPEYPETGFGYIKKGAKNDNFFIIDKFVEKPNLETAQKYFKSGDYFWNGGMFMFKAQTLIDEIAKYEPEILEACRLSLNNSKIEGNAIFLEKESFAKNNSISFDYAVMEKSDKSAVAILNNSGWSDIGSYKALWEMSQKDENGNVKPEKSVVINTKNCFIKSNTKQLISVVGVDDLVVVATEDAIMVVPKEKCQDVKKIVDALKEKNEKSYL